MRSNEEVLKSLPPAVTQRIEVLLKSVDQDAIADQVEAIKAATTNMSNANAVAAAAVLLELCTIGLDDEWFDAATTAATLMAANMRRQRLAQGAGQVGHA